MGGRGVAYNRNKENRFETSYNCACWSKKVFHLLVIKVQNTSKLGKLVRRLYTGSWVINGSLQYDSVWWFPTEPRTNCRRKDDFGGDLVTRAWEEVFICFELIALLSAPQCTLWSECQYSNALQISGTRSPGTHWISTQSKVQQDTFEKEATGRDFSFTEKLSAGQFLFQYSQLLTCFHDHSL